MPSPVLVKHTLQIHGEERVGGRTIAEVSHLLALLHLAESCLWNEHNHHRIFMFIAVSMTSKHVSASSLCWPTYIRLQHGIKQQ